MSSPEVRRRRLLEYLYKNRHRSVSNTDIELILGAGYEAELQYQHDKGKVEFHYLPGTHKLMFDVRITAPGVDEIESEKTAHRAEPFLDRKDDIEFMKQFRENIDRYLFLGYAPPVDPEAHEYDSEALGEINAELQKNEFQELRRAISEMTPRAKSLLSQCGVTPTILNYPPPSVPKSKILDVIDQAIGVLKTKKPEQIATRRPIEERYVFISHSSKDSTVVSATKQAFQDLPLKLYFAEDKPRGAPPSREFAQAVKHAEALFVFFTHNSIIGDTRDWIVYEIGVAVGHDRPVYSWKERYLTKDQLPKLLEQVSIHREFELSGDGTIRLTGEIREAAKNL